MSEKYSFQSPFVYGADNPVRFFDFMGMNAELFITGESADEATKQLQQSTSLTLSRDGETGKVTATGEAKSEEDQKLLTIINSTDVDVNVTATSSNVTSTGANYLGGAFMGNKVTTESLLVVQGAKPYQPIAEVNYNKATTFQEVNPAITKQMDSYYNTPGKGMLHEITESYEGGVISKQAGVSSPNAASSESVYNQAHDAATPQPGPVYRRDNRGVREYYLKQEGKPEKKIKLN